MNINQLHAEETTSYNIPNEQLLRQSYDALGIKELESKLKAAIGVYRSQKKRGSGYRSLKADIERKLFLHLDRQGYSQDKIDEIMQKRVPKHSYIHKFYNGTSICINYMNTLAFFFDIQFLVTNFEFE